MFIDGIPGSLIDKAGFRSRNRTPGSLPWKPAFSTLSCLLDKICDIRHCGRVGPTNQHDRHKKAKAPVPSSSFAPDQGGGSSKQGVGGAKNPWVRTGHQWNLTIATYNVRSLLQEERLVELEEELEGVKWDIIGLGEVRRRGEDFTELKSGHHFYHIGTKDKSEAGVGFLIHKSIAGNITEVKGINERLAQLTVKINKRYKIKVIQVYAPTSTHNDEEVDKLYEEITELLKNSKTQFTIVMGDFNAKVGKREDGEECTIICQQVGNGPGEAQMEAQRMKLTSFSQTVHTSFKTLERHKLLRPKQSSINLEKLQEKRIEFQLQLQNQFQLLADECPEERTLELWNDQIVETTQKLAMDIAGKKPKTRETKISDSTRTLMEKRRSMKAEGTNIQRVEYTDTCKTIRKKLREDIRSYNTKMIKSTIEENKSLKKTYKKLAQGKQKITSLLDSNGQEITDQDEILKRIEEFYEQLYASDTETDEPGEPQEEIPNVTNWEVQHAVNQMKRGKSPGPDNVLIDTIKEGGDIITKELAKLYTTCMQKGRVPHQWKEATMIILHKKGDKRDLKNYRPISLLSNLYKLYTRLLTNRLEIILDGNQPREQAGFRKGFSTMDHIHTINQLKEKCQEYNIPLCVAFIDYEKAFDSVETSPVLNALKEQGINNAYLKIFKDIYSDCYNTVKMHKDSDRIMIKKGVRQGTLSHRSFLYFF
ncbi:uncharacterized protein [Amphiura filiformis]|uniref:uncharacterized protein n=1 Tax=Amphiura filiformis TaxID=82378 RepID=UPI003B220E42